MAKLNYKLASIILLSMMLIVSCAKQEIQKQIQPTVEQPQTEQLSEQPDLNASNEYFTEFYLAKIPVGQKLGPPNFPAKTTIFTSADQFCSNWNQKKIIPAGSMATAVYDTNSKQYIVQKISFPREINAGSNAGCQDMKFAAGKYEYKIYVNDILVEVLPFEVR